MTLLSTLPFHIVCQLLAPTATNVNDTTIALIMEKLQSQSENKLTTELPEVNVSVSDIDKQPSGASGTNDSIVDNLQSTSTHKPTTELPAVNVSVSNIDEQSSESSNGGQVTESSLVSPSDCEQPKTLPQGYVAFPDIGLAYKVSDDVVDWKEARKRCFKEGAQLALIDTFKKVEYVVNQKKSNNPIHVGIHESFNSYDWVRVSDGATVPSVPWGRWDRDDFFDIEEDCVMIQYIQNIHGLRASFCTINGNYVCEIPLPKNYIDQRFVVPSF